MRPRVSEGLYSTFKCVGETENITRSMIEDKEFLESCVEKSLLFLKSIPNSVHYWAQRKRDVFAMIRQLGKPTMFLIMSANEIPWPRFLNALHPLKRDRELEDPMKNYITYFSYHRSILSITNST
jgi:hypothetical protein